MQVTFYVDRADIASYMAREPDQVLDLLASLAGEFRTAEDVEQWAAALAAEHSGSASHQTVLPFLRLLCDALEVQEALP